MFKKITSVLGTITLICFSFYYTDSAIDLIKKTDPIMKQIIEYSNDYGNTSTDSILINNNIIPGTKGTIVDIEESYNKMKRLGKFDKSLIVFEEVLPNLSISNNYDNYIISGNDTNRVSLVFTIKNSSYLEEILAILNKKNVKATFFIESNMFENSTDIIKTILTYGHDVELLDNTYEISTIKKYNSIKKTIANDTFSYCYTTTKNEELLNNCKKEKMHTIIPTIITGNYPYSDIKNSLNNGAIISFENNQNTVRELSSIINYIGQKGKKITILEKLLEE